MIQAHNTFVEKSKLSLILSSKESPDQSINTGDTVEVYLNMDKYMHGKWVSPRMVHYLCIESSTGVLLTKQGRNSFAALEDVRSIIVDERIYLKIQQEIEDWDFLLKKYLKRASKMMLEDQ